jgi:hypothetical protein
MTAGAARASAVRPVTPRAAVALTPYVVGQGAELCRQPTEVPRNPQRQHVSPQDHEVAIDVVPLAVVGLEHREREEHRLAEDEQQSP